jgi:L-fuculose-phosphate aldolase
MSDVMLLNEIVSVGRELSERGLQTTRSGNISARAGEVFFITKTGTNLGRLNTCDIIVVNIDDDKVAVPVGASIETAVHRAVYRETKARAIVHAHPPYAIGLAHSLPMAYVTPIHNEGLVGLKRVPILDTSVPGREACEEPRPIVAHLSRWCSLIIRGHGAFAVGSDLQEALYRLLLVEEVCKIHCIAQSLGSSYVKGISRPNPKAEEQSDFSCSPQMRD